MESYESGQEIENHHLLEKIGGGGSGEVWKADFLGQTVALKVFSQEECERLKGAIEAHYQLTHLNSPQNRFFVPFEHIQLTGPSRYIRMKWIEGVTLEEYLADSGPLEVNKALPLAKQILKGLEVIHQQKLIHGDLNPSNLLLPFGGTPLLTDIGLGKPQELNHSLTEEEDEKGRARVGYSSPERFQEGVGPAADLYSFGKILYVMLTGAEATTIKPLSEFSTLQFPDRSQIERFIFQCLEKDPKDRFENATKAIEALDSLQFDVKRKSDAKWEPALFIPMCLALVFVCVYMVPTLFDPAKDNPENWFFQAENAFELEKNYEKALQLYSKALIPYKNDYRIYRNMGFCHLKLKEYDEARYAFIKSIELNSRQSDSLFYLGTIWEHSDKERAIQYYEKSIQVEPVYFESYKNIGTYYQKELTALLQKKQNSQLTSERVESARDLYEKSLKNPSTYDEKSLLDFGKCFYWLEELEVSRKLLSLVSREGPAGGEASFFIGLTWHEIDRRKEIGHYEFAIKANPPYFWASVNIGNSYMEELEKTIENEAKNKVIRDPIQQVEFQKFKERLLSKAKKAYQRALGSDSKLPEAHLGLGNVYANLSDFNMAIRHYLKISKQHKEIYSQALFSTAICYKRLNEIAKSEEFLVKLKELDPGKAIELEKILNS